MQAQLDCLSSSCNTISSALTNARATAAGLLAESDKATRELAALEHRRALVEQFLDKYQLSNDEVRQDSLPPRVDGRRGAGATVISWQAVRYKAYRFLPTACNPAWSVHPHVRGMLPDMTVTPDQHFPAGPHQDHD